MISPKKLLEIEGIDADSPETEFAIPKPGLRLSSQTEANEACSFGKISKEIYRGMVSAAGYQEIANQDIDIYCHLGWEGNLENKGQGGWGLKHPLFDASHIDPIHEHYQKIKNSPNKISSLICCLLDICVYINQINNPKFKDKISGFWSEPTGKFIFFIHLPGFKKPLFLALFPEAQYGKNTYGFSLCTLFPTTYEKLAGFQKDHKNYKAISFEKRVPTKTISSSSTIKSPQKEKKEDRVITPINLPKEESLKTSFPAEANQKTLGLTKQKEELREKNQKVEKDIPLKINITKDETVKLDNSIIPEDSYGQLYKKFVLDKNAIAESSAVLAELVDSEFQDSSATFPEVAKKLKQTETIAYRYYIFPVTIREDIVNSITDYYTLEKDINQQICELQKEIEEYKTLLEKNISALNQHFLWFASPKKQKQKFDNNSFRNCANFFIATKTGMQVKYNELRNRYISTADLYTKNLEKMKKQYQQIEENKILISLLPHEIIYIHNDAVAFKQKNALLITAHRETQLSVDKLVSTAFIKLITLANKFLQFCLHKNLELQTITSNSPYLELKQLIQYIIIRFDELVDFCKKEKSDAMEGFIKLHNQLVPQVSTTISSPTTHK